MGERKLEKKKREKEIRRRRREKPQLLSRFPSNQTVGSGQSKRQSWSMHRELRVGTKISGFHQTPRGMGFSHTRFNSCLRSIQMVDVFGTETALHFSPKNLGVNAGFGTVSGQSKAGFSGLFSNSPELNFRDCFWVV